MGRLGRRLGGPGTIGANAQHAGAFTYNVGGFAAGLDRRSPTTSGPAHGRLPTGTQWVVGFDGRGMTDTVQAGLYGGYRRAGLRRRPPGLRLQRQPDVARTSTSRACSRAPPGRTGANQFYGQFETGYRFDLGGIAEAFVTPFARLQGYTGIQNGFTETGAQSLNLRSRSRPPTRCAR